MPTQSTYQNSKCVQVSYQDHKADSVIDGQGVRRTREAYVVLWDGFAHPDVCLDASDGTKSIPKRGDAHPTRSGLYARTIGPCAAVGRDPSRRAFELTVEYTNEGGGITPGPLSLPPAFRWAWQEDGSQAPFQLDFNPAGQKVVENTAHDRLDWIQRVNGTCLVSVRKNYAPGDAPLALIRKYNSYLPDDAAGECVPVCNADAFTIDGVPVGVYQARWRGADVSEVQYADGVPFRTVDYSLALRHSWAVVAENRGFYALNDAGQKARIADGIDPGDRGEGHATPWPLDADGRKLANRTDKPARATVYPYPRLPFAPFDFTTMVGGFTQPATDPAGI